MTRCSVMTVVMFQIIPFFSFLVFDVAFLLFLNFSAFAPSGVFLLECFGPCFFGAQREPSMERPTLMPFRNSDPGEPLGCWACWLPGSSFSFAKKSTEK